jgi:cyclopropane fatty-acyl-phospholipid synthase-like methyltransferase
VTRWDLRYLGRPPWDSGVTPPEVVRVVEGERLPPGRALDLGCGTGTNLLYFARHGFEAVGVDISRVAVLRARWKLRRAGAQRTLVVPGDVSRLPAAVRARAPYDLALDIGCFHSLDADARARYAAGLHAVLRRGALFLLYAFRPTSGSAAFGPRGVSAADLERAFRDGFRLEAVTEGEFHGRTSAWYRFRGDSKSPI